jgi:hypothetical protein
VTAAWVGPRATCAASSPKRRLTSVPCECLNWCGCQCGSSAALQSAQRSAGFFG